MDFSRLRSNQPFRYYYSLTPRATLNTRTGAVFSPLGKSTGTDFTFSAWQIHTHLLWSGALAFELDVMKIVPFFGVACL